MRSSTLIFFALAAGALATPAAKSSKTPAHMTQITSSHKVKATTKSSKTNAHKAKTTSAHRVKTTAKSSETNAHKAKTISAHNVKTTAKPTPTKTSAASFSQVTPNVPASDVVTGRYTLANVPTECTDAFVPYQTTFWAQQNQMNMQDTINPSWWFPSTPVDWTFSTNTTGVFFRNPSWIVDGSSPSLNLKPRTKMSSFTLTMDQTDGGGQVLLWMISQDNGTTPAVSRWNGTVEESTEPYWEQVTYQLTISGQLPCANPVGNDTCTNNKINMTTESWSSYGVDGFFQSWYTNRSAEFAVNGGMMQTFGKDFKIGNDHTCTIDNACSLANACSDLPDHGADDNSAQIYLVWQSLQNLSDMLNRMYNNLNIAETDTMTKIAQIALEYYIPIQAPAPPPNPLLLASPILGMLGAFGGLLPTVGPGVGAVFGAAGGLADAINGQKTSFPPAPDPQFAQSDADLGAVFGNFTSSARTALENVHTGIFQSGTNATSLLSGGRFVDRTALNIDCDDCIPAAQQWLEQFLTLKMINYMWLKQNVFVTFMPYGPVIQLDAMDQTNFTIDACYSNWISGRNGNDEITLTTCLPTGMARLTYYNKLGNSSQTSPDDDGSVNLNGMPPGGASNQLFNSTSTVSVGFQAKWAAESSVRGFLQNGLGYDAITDLSNQIVQQGSVYGGNVGPQLTELWNINATSAGMFTLPVCQIRDLNYWPTFYGQGGRRSYNDYCICYNDLNDNGPNGPSFSDVTLGNLTTFVTSWSSAQCDKGAGTEPSIGGSPDSLPPRAAGASAAYVPLPWP